MPTEKQWMKDVAAELLCTYEVWDETRDVAVTEEQVIRILAAHAPQEQRCPECREVSHPPNDVGFGCQHDRRTYPEPPLPAPPVQATAQPSETDKWFGPGMLAEFERRDAELPDAPSAPGEEQKS